jgi:serine/threonine protein kinase
MELRSRKLAHRDIKPSNILLNTEKNGEHVYKFADFGASKLYGHSALQTVAGTETHLHPYILHTLAYKTRERKPYQPQVDLWSIGTSLYQMLTHKLPFSNDIICTTANVDERRKTV